MMVRKKRQQRGLQRQTNYREQRKIVLIVCGAKQTEPNYFNHLKQRLKLGSVTVRPCKNKVDPIHVVDCALREKEGVEHAGRREPYDEVWCVMDVEAPPLETMKAAVSKAEESGILLALTNPCFEFWYILHFQQTAQQFDRSKQVVQELTKCLKKHKLKYRKNDPHFPSKIYPLTGTAVANAKLAAQQKGCDCQPPSLCICTPSTAVHELVKLLHDIVQKDIPPLDRD